jgi:hypothetical protein
LAAAALNQIGPALETPTDSIGANTALEPTESIAVYPERGSGHERGIVEARKVMAPAMSLGLPT